MDANWSLRNTALAATSGPQQNDGNGTHLLCFHSLCRCPGALVFTSSHSIPATSHHFLLCPVGFFSFSRTCQAPTASEPLHSLFLLLAPCHGFQVTGPTLSFRCHYVTHAEQYHQWSVDLNSPTSHFIVAPSLLLSLALISILHSQYVCFLSVPLTEVKAPGE